MSAISTRTPEVTVEYTSRNQRVTKHFTNAHSAKRFYVSKDRSGHFPKIVGTNPERNRTMTTETTTTSAPKSTKKKTAKKAAASKSKSTKKAAPKKKAATKKADKAASGEAGVERSHDLPWNDKKVKVFKALKQLKAKGPMQARSAKDVAKKAGVSPRDVRHYSYHARVSGLIDIAEIEDQRGYAFYLTSSGWNINPSDELKKQKEAKK